jgi:hypothetical protein
VLAGPPGVPDPATLFAAPPIKVPAAEPIKDEPMSARRAQLTDPIMRAVKQDLLRWKQGRRPPMTVRSHAFRPNTLVVRCEPHPIAEIWRANGWLLLRTHWQSLTGGLTWIELSDPSSWERLHAELARPYETIRSILQGKT